MAIKTLVRYALVDKETLEPAMWCHQDDMEDPVVAPTLEKLITFAANWADYASSDFVLKLCSGGDYSKYKIVKEIVEIHGLDGEDLVQYNKLVVEAATADLVKVSNFQSGNCV